MSQDIAKLGDDPLELRFQYGIIGGRFGQFICILFFIGILVLSFQSTQYLVGLITVLILQFIAFGIMKYYISLQSEIISTRISEFTSASQIRHDDMISAVEMKVKSSKRNKKATKKPKVALVAANEHDVNVNEIIVDTDQIKIVPTDENDNEYDDNIDDNVL